MANLDLRPLSLGEILDRSFSLYRQNFALFLGIAAIPQLFVLTLNLAEAFLGTPRGFQAASRVATSPFLTVMTVVLGLLAALASLIAYLFTQGATVHAVADLYLGRSTTVGDSLRKVRHQIGTLFGVGVLNGLAVGAAAIFLIVPGVYLMCRLLAAVPAAVLEKLGPGASLQRSFDLTRGYAGRAFLIFLLYVILLVMVMTLFAGLPAGIGAITARTHPEMTWVWTAIGQISTSVGTVLVSPFFLIAASLFYFDLRVRKEAFDLQMMMNPDAPVGPVAGGVPGVVS